MQINKILYPTDFSPCSRQALDHALFLAEQFDAELHMFHAAVLNADDPGNPESHFLGGEEILERLFEISSSRLAEWIPTDRRQAVSIKEIQERGYSAAPLVLEYADKEDVDLIVMGTHGHGALGRIFLGSVADRVVRYAGCPVLTVRESDSSREMTALERILVPMDFSEHSRAALAYAKDLAVMYGASLQLLHVIHTGTFPTLYGPVGDMFDISEVESISLRSMDEAMREKPGAEVSYDKYVVNGRPATEIAAFARDHASDLIVISTHGLSGLDRAVSGSTAGEVVQHAACPVLTIKSHGKLLLDDGPSAETVAAE
jgi:nucleotide-binding universal stress UspA family protein